MPYEPIIGVGPKVPIDDLDLNLQGDNNRWSKPVQYDEEYKNIIRWFGTQCSKLPTDVMLIAQSREGDITDDTMGEPSLPTVLQFGSGANAFRTPAAEAGAFPHNTRIGLIRHFGGGDAFAFVRYEPPKPPQADGKPSPIGAKWPERGSNAYRPAEDNPTAKGFAVGDKYADATGTYQLDKQWWGWLPFSVWIKVA